MGHGWGKPNSNAVVAATITGDATKAAIFGYDTSATMVSGTAPARRVGFFYYGGNGGTTFNTNAAKLFDASVQWAAKSVPLVEYERDVTDRIIERRVSGILEARYAHTASGDTPTLTLDASGAVIGASLGLPGGVLYQWIPATAGASKWEYPNLQGSLVATTNNTGVKVGATRVYDPDGNQISGQAANSMPGQFDYGWLGGHQRPLEHQDGLQPVVQMGARQYHPVTGRFLEVDPIEGGVDNDYGYVADPVNVEDLSGMAVGPHQAWYCASSFSKAGACFVYATSYRSKAKDFGKAISRKYGGQAGNAVQHVYWMALIARVEGRDWAIGLGEAHERDGGNGPADTHKDLLNNQIGASLGVRARQRGWSDSRLRSEVERALCRGDLWVLGTRGSLRQSSCNSGSVK
jgi:RHS repeat-associated protein